MGSALEHLVVVGGTPKDWDAITPDEWERLFDRLRRVAVAAGARWLTVRPYGPQPATGDGERFREVIPGECTFIVDPLAGDCLEENLTPLGRAYYAASTLNCVPTSLSQPGGLALGAQAGEARLREVVTRAGFSRFRRAVEAPFNLVIEARP